MLALLNQFTFTQVIIGGVVIVLLNTFLLRWAMSRLQADPRDDLDARAKQDADALNDERARSTVATPRPRRLQPAAPGTGKSLAESGLGSAETVTPAQQGGALSPGSSRSANPRDIKVYPEGPEPALAAATTIASMAGAAAAGGGKGPGGGSQTQPPAAGAEKTADKKLEPVVGKPGGVPPGAPDKGKKADAPAEKPVSLPPFAATAGAADEPSAGKVGLISADKPAAPPQTVPPSGQGGPSAPPVSLTKPAGGEGKPSFGLIESQNKPGDSADMKKSNPVKPGATSEPAASGLTLIPAGASAAPAPDATKAAGALKTSEPSPAAASGTSPVVPETTASTTPPPGVPEVPAKSFWRPRIFLPSKAPSGKSGDPAEVKPGAGSATTVTPPPVATAQPPAPAAEKKSEEIPAIKPPADKPPADKPLADKPVTPEIPAVPAKLAPVVPLISAATALAPAIATAPAAVAPPVPAPAAPAKTAFTPAPVPAARSEDQAKKPVESVAEVSITKPKPVMSTETTTTALPGGKASAQLTLGFEITSLQLTPFFKLGGVQLRPVSNVVSLNLVASEQADSPMAAGISFEIEKVELNEQSHLRSILLRPLGQAQPAAIPQPKLSVDAVQITQGGEGSIQITSSQQTPTSIQLVATLSIASMEFTPSFEIRSMLLEPTSNSVQLHLAAKQRPGGMELPPTFDIASIKVADSQIQSLSLSPAVAAK